jgi:hypothetical protein
MAPGRPDSVPDESEEAFFRTTGELGDDNGRRVDEGEKFVKMGARGLSSGVMTGW